MDLNISFIIPVFNRPQEIQELLDSFVGLNYNGTYEIVIIEDGSAISSKPIVDAFSDKLNISYYFKENSGPGDSRNFGMSKAKGNYFIILDSDCILPPDYLTNILDVLNKEFTDCFGGPDAAHPSFSNLQKAINFSMTSFITTGGIRGNKKSINTFEPRSFNMGISKEAFLRSGGFGNIHPGEDPDLSIRLNKLGFRTKLISNVFVYHKRRISWAKFFKQVYKFGLARPILNKWHPDTKRFTYWLPTLFSMGLLLSVLLLFFGYAFFLLVYVIYFMLVFVVSLIKNKNILVSIMSVIATLIQFLGYGFGFIFSTVKISIFNKKPDEVFPFLFFKTK